MHSAFADHSLVDTYVASKLWQVAEGAEQQKSSASDLRRLATTCNQLNNVWPAFPLRVLAHADVGHASSALGL
jgi:hypothetical protein